MAGSVNKVTIVGRLGRDPEVRSFQNGGRVCNLSVATDEGWKDKNTGERRSKTEWHRIKIQNDGLIGVAERFLKKGSRVYLEGQLETRKFEKNGQEQYSTEIVLKGYGCALVLMDSKNSGDGGSSDGGGYSQSGQGYRENYSQRPDAKPADAAFDDEVPF